MQFYYIASRYYDPDTGRWLSMEPNAFRGWFDRQNAFLGYNAFVYCMNNPVNLCDPTGQWTYSINFGFVIGAFGGGYTVNVGIAVDEEDMFAFQFTYSVPNNKKTRNTLLGATAGIYVGVQHTSYTSIEKLKGQSVSAGANTPVLGVDIIKDYQSNDNVGWGLTLGPSIGADLHVDETYTYTSRPYRSVIKIIKDWIIK